MTKLSLSRVLFFAFLTLFLGHQQPISADTSAVGWVGNMWPAAGSSSPASGTTFDVYLQVYKDGVTNGAGQGAGITCTVHWGIVGSAWSGLNMSYHTDQNNNDEYKGSINTTSLADGTYGFTGYCTEGGTQTWQQAGDAFLVVNRSGGVIDQRAFWLARDIIAWNDNSANATYELVSAPNGNLSVPATAGTGIQLTYNGTLTASSYPKMPNANGYKAWKIPAGSIAQVPTFLKGEVAIAAYNSSGNLITATGLQIQGVLDDLFPYTGELGVTFSPITSFNSSPANPLSPSCRSSAILKRSK